MPTLRTTAPPAAIIRTPIRAPGMSADAGLPIASAAISGVLVATTAAAAAIGISIVAGADTLAGIPLVLAGWTITALTVTTADWFHQRAESREAIWAIEERAGEDRDGDGQIGRPHGIPVNAPVPADLEEAMRKKATRMLDAIYTRNSTTFTSVRAVCPEIDRADYDEIRDQLIRIEIARWIGTGRSHGWQPRDGISLKEAQSRARKEIIWLALPSPASTRS